MGAIGATDGEDVVRFQKLGICHRCAHHRGVETCRAFPDGIPYEILGGDVDHTRPYPGDNGITFLGVVN
jgi:hypothetical protein